MSDAARQPRSKEEQTEATGAIAVNRARLTAERVLLVFALLLFGLAAVQFVRSCSRAEVEDYHDDWADTALHDNNYFEGILTKNYVSQFWSPLTSFEGTPLYRRSHGTSNRKLTLRAIAVGTTDSGHTLYRASWLDDEPKGVFALKLSPTDEAGYARFVEVGPQKYFKRDYNPPDGGEEDEEGAENAAAEPAEDEP